MPENDKRKRPAILRRGQYTADKPQQCSAAICPLEIQDEEVKVEAPEVEEIEVKEEDEESEEEDDEFYVGEENQIEEIGNASQKIDHFNFAKIAQNTARSEASRPYIPYFDF